MYERTAYEAHNPFGARRAGDAVNEPTHIDVNTWYTSGPVFRVELVMKFETEADARELDEQVRRIRAEIAEGRKPHVQLILGTVTPSAAAGAKEEE